MISSGLFAATQPAAPLAERLRTKHIDEMAGQSHLWGEVILFKCAKKPD